MLRMTTGPRTFLFSILFGMAGFFFLFSAIGANAWYTGKITRIYMFPGGFVLTLDTSVLDDCQYKYVYFLSSVLDDKTVDRALSIALTAQSGEKTVGLVIDKALNGPGGRCDATGSFDIKD